MTFYLTPQLVEIGRGLDFVPRDPPPPDDVDKATRIWVTGDAGTADANAVAVRDAYQAYTGTRHTGLFLTLGDIAYTHGTDLQYQAAFF